MSGIAISDKEFADIRGWIYRVAGINLTPEKKALVCGRLEKRLLQTGTSSYRDYFALANQPGNEPELRTALDLLTTNETYFFREPKHFQFLREHVSGGDRPGRQWRIWSAASSSGEEAFSIAMTMADLLGVDRWEVIGSDLSTRVLQKAATGVYPLARMEEFPREYLKRYCLKGTGPEDGKFMIDTTLRQRVHFLQANLNSTLPDVGRFDIIFLRNVLIYFDAETKCRVIERVCAHLEAGGYFIVSHAESLHGLNIALTQVKPSIYRKA
jgi:chemotaxis protein methyltransferase CheR